MLKISNVLWTLVFLVIAVSTITVSLSFLLLGGVIITLYGLFRYYFPKKNKSRFYHTKTQHYTFGEVVDLKSEVIKETIDLTKDKNYIKK